MKNKGTIVVDTKSYQEREELVQFLAEKHLLASVLGSSNDFQYVIIYTGDVLFVSVITKEKLSTLKGYTHYESVEEFYREFE